MTIRRTIILLTVPLFLLLAVVNGALLYFQEKAEMSHALSEQALAAAVTTAEFINSMDDPAAELADPVRMHALKDADRQITGLEGLMLVLPGGKAQPLAPSTRPWSLEGLERPDRPVALHADPDSPDARHFVALAPTKGGAFVAARIDAEPMFAQMALVTRAVALIVLIAGLTAAVLAWFVARRIVRELEKNHEAILAIGAGQPGGGEADLTIREARDLAGAVRLMEASTGAAAVRSRRVTAQRDRERSVASALAASRAAAFAPVSADLAGARVSARIAGDAPAGSFFALRADGTEGLLVIGRCGGATPQDAFANAAAARRAIEAGESLDAATAAHAIEEVRTIAWDVARPLPAEVQLLVLGETERAASYAARNRDAAPDALLDGIETLLQPAGVLAAVSAR